LALRQQVLFILRRIRAGTRWTLFNESNPDTWKEISQLVNDFMCRLHEQGLLKGESPHQSFYVKCDSDTNDGLVDRLGEVAFIVGFAVRRPGELLAFRIQRSRGGCRITELGWQSHLELAS
jgi:phage tail sheath protein FI